MAELGPLLHARAPAIGSSSLADRVAGAYASGGVIHPLTEPLAAEGGLAVLFGNLAPRSAVVKQSGVGEAMMVCAGPARVCSSEGEVGAKLLANEVHPGDVLVIRYEGPRGASMWT